jgi:pilus assembly protein CpaF
MLNIEIRKGEAPVRFVQAPAESVIGKSAQAEIRLDGWRISKEHARLFSTPPAATQIPPLMATSNSPT